MKSFAFGFWCDTTFTLDGFEVYHDRMPASTEVTPFRLEAFP